MSLLIVPIGIPGSGKTTLGKQLKEIFGNEIIFTNPPKDKLAMIEYYANKNNIDIKNIEEFQNNNLTIDNELLIIQGIKDNKIIYVDDLINDKPLTFFEKFNNLFIFFERSEFSYEECKKSLLPELTGDFLKESLKIYFSYKELLKNKNYINYKDNFEEIKEKIKKCHY